LQLRDELDDEPPPETRTTLYRIVLEVLANVRKHAHATSVEVVLSAVGGGFRLRVEDDGRGFQLEGDGADRPGHLGFSAMRERAEMAGGRLSLESEPGAGTTVEVWLPGP
jgi:signal transduction histidine kinase